MSGLTKNKRLTIKPNELKRLYWDLGLSMIEIAKKLNSTSGTIKNYMRRFDIPARSRSEAASLAINKGRAYRPSGEFHPGYKQRTSLDEMEKLYNEERLTQKEIAILANVTPGRIAQLFREHHITLRNWKERRQLAVKRGHLDMKEAISHRNENYHRGPKPDPILEIKCQQCGKHFRTSRYFLSRGWDKYCSLKCYALARENKVKRICPVCGNEFETVPANIKRGHGIYCSMFCQRRARPTQIEVKVLSELKQKGLSVIPQYKPPGIWTWVDAYLPDYRTCIYCDGDYWHSISKRQAKDIEIDMMLRANGYRVFRLKENDINKNTKRIVNKVLRGLL